MHHRHITAVQDVRNELFALLAYARETYLRDVIDSGKLYRRFVDDFINSHRYSANTYRLFCVSTVRMEDMEALLSCKEGFLIRVNNIRRVAVLFDALLEKSYILSNWQPVLARGKFLLSKDGKRIVTATSLSSALSAAKNNMTSVFYAIKATINQILER